MLYRAANPWAGSIMDIRRMERDGPSYYRADTRSSRLYSLVHAACHEIRRRRFDDALAHARLGRRLDPHNPTFDYVAACVAVEKHDSASALRLIDQGNAKGCLRLYSDDRESPEEWSWPETVLICYAGRYILSERPDDRPALVSVLLMAHKLVWAEPPDPNRLLQALALRHSAASLLKEMALKEGDAPLAKLCQALMLETREVQFAERRHLMWKKRGLAKETRAWILARAVGSQSASSREVLALYVLEKHAEWAEQLRTDYLRLRMLRGL